MRRGDYEVVLMDVQMPEMDGFAATAAVRAFESEQGGHTPIIAMTAHAMKGDRERCLQAGMDAYVAKPVVPAELYAAVEADYENASVYSASPSATGGDMLQATDAGQSASAAVQNSAADPLPAWAEAVARFGGKEDLVLELAGMFLEEGPQLMQQIRDHIEAGSAAELRRAAHTLKGSADVIGATPVMAVTAQLEELGRAENLAQATVLCAELARQMEDLLAAVRLRVS